MNKENQNVEWKEPWRDEYLKWICGFANAQGGKLYIGIMDDGTVCGVSDVKRLLEDIPNKIQSKLSIVADVNLLSKDGVNYIEIVVHPQMFPVNFNGEYHYRSGSTKQQLVGNALTNFLMLRTGMRWDNAPVNGVAFDDLDKESFDIFRREAVRNNRMKKEDLQIPRDELLTKLGAVSDGKISRAGLMCFHREAERFVCGCYVKVGRFSGSEILYQDEVRGSLMLMADRAIDLIFFKYLKAAISYHKETRVEKYPYARDAIREALYNALIHSNWSMGIPVQVRIEDSTLWISNACTLPFGWTVENLMGEHTSVPFNPSIANVFFRAGYIESWGRGISKICEACKNDGYPLPVYTVSGVDLRIKFTALDCTAGEEKANDKTNAVLQNTDYDKETSNYVEDENSKVKGGEKCGVESRVEVPNKSQGVPNKSQGVPNKSQGVPNKSQGVPNKLFEVSENSDGFVCQILEKCGVDSDTSLNVLKIIFKIPGITGVEIGEKLGMSDRAVRKQIKKLQDVGLLQRCGSRKTGHWQVILKEKV